MKIRRGDKVKVISGKDRGREGVVTKVSRRRNEVWVEGLNIYKKHIRPSAQSQEGGIIEIQKPLPASKVQLICPHCQETARVGFVFKDQRKVRVCKKCQVEL
jgi:large subunit ribosomal protein L24